MKDKTLFLAWQDKAKTKRWFPVGRLDVNVPDLTSFRFRYVNGAEMARNDAGFEPLYDFPDFYKDYRAPELFPLFKNRVITPGRKDFHDYLQLLGLQETNNPIEILSVDGGYRATDTFEVFPKIERHKGGAFSCRFFLHGWSHVNEDAKERISRLEAGEKLFVTLELTNPATHHAVQIQTNDYYMIGWAPRYLVNDLIGAMAKSSDYSAHVVRINPIPAPSKQRLLIELRGHWPDYKPMESKEYKVLSK